MRQARYGVKSRHLALLSPYRLVGRGCIPTLQHPPDACDGTLDASGNRKKTRLESLILTHQTQHLNWNWFHRVYQEPVEAREIRKNGG
ncbi:hypothetical protein TNCV_980491 [Trichonephila clavipes]|uniref:Uncharacterized protein n=1 Tax=Trichonephila clavipes TaxID=2585209 RepID=A0A8X6RXR9_TRICX|nr:hypothetical protein TNCV_980491 [Trichonephila clavipes]